MLFFASSSGTAGLTGLKLSIIETGSEPETKSIVYPLLLSQLFYASESSFILPSEFKAPKILFKF